ncbi:hypothetical protein SAMN02745131_01413 [Flavisolibacter ginsengisoli DSM 18119]|jgi:hypothetical protein|uniref:Uncharacterized protein n=1 Tax=Flavisolibacter ginsengisoli DSM 18119 TaxID=1121884 RepID=A0A1M4XBP6_9BACT|nr:hypothetical protein SAMN02745131_01413 [Flavisolibacter ginsengisoli DSM 18119]
MWGKNDISKLILKYLFLNKAHENELVTEFMPKTSLNSATVRYRNLPVGFLFF